MDTNLLFLAQKQDIEKPEGDTLDVLPDSVIVPEVVSLVSSVQQSLQVQLVL